MPCFKILTNLPKNKIPNDFVKRITPILSRTVGKPENVFICAVAPDSQISFGGDQTKPGAVATLESIGHIDAERNKQVVKEVTQFVTEEMGIPPERFFMTFYDIKNYNVGINGTTIG
ncbi:unnamed protein product [Chilo suppressalis]|uniref:L-dopachrome isomerase n=1 Tax=Chilo suppressalis TaxID=168631 RepID=A0ABN8B886_CHISP|nr:hypothetical protein evm_005728 [Chilo suppressalis]CAH0402116.1 unnamed protein product [Chilo suppressalis]